MESASATLKPAIAFLGRSKFLKDFLIGVKVEVEPIGVLKRK